MSAAPLATTPDAWRISFDPRAQLKAGLITFAFLGVFYNVLLDCMWRWQNEAADWGHGWIIPFFSAYLVKLRWEQIRAQPIVGAWAGMPLIIAGLIGYQLTLWILPFVYLRALAMLVCLLGVVVLLCGLPVVRYIWVPWLYLLFAIPLPRHYYFMLTDPLAQLAGVVAVGFLQILPLDDLDLTGSTIRYLHDGRAGELFVADACAGMRATITLCALGVALTFISDRPWWHRAIMIAACVPIAVLSNFVRVIITCVLHIYVDKRYAEGTWHTLLGLATLVLAFFMFNGLGWVLSNLFTPDDDEGDSDGAIRDHPGEAVQRA